jgi:hypothetical protein
VNWVDDQIDGSMAIQSQNHCHTFKFVLAKDLQQLSHDHFKAFFHFFELLEAGTIVGANYAPGQICVSSLQNASSFWKTLKQVGLVREIENFVGGVHA